MTYLIIYINNKPTINFNFYQKEKNYKFEFFFLTITNSVEKEPNKILLTF